MDRSNLKRILEEDDTSAKAPPAKKVRFPKGKKVKPEDEKARVGDAIGPTPHTDPSLAAKERAKRRSEEKVKLSGEIAKLYTDDDDASGDEARKSGRQNFVEDGMQFEPFNLEKEKEEGYFDADGNFVEYVDKNQVKDAWLDSLNKAVDPETTRKFAAKNGDGGEGDDEGGQDLSSDEIGKIKRRIADALEPEETVLQALRRLKGNKKEKMPAERKAVFDQLTEDAMVLMMKNGENNVYDEEKEVFEREAQGYESLAKARMGEGKSILDELESDAGALNSIASIGGVGGGEGGGTVADDDAFDMFGDDEPAVVANAAAAAAAAEPGLENNGGGLGNDYVFDDASGYYYSHSLGYYYDPNTGLYCSAASGLWYSYNAETGTYDEVAHQAPEATAAAVN
ncbi:PREDICTED: CD2 antigen cytoplasmic tail-binding protein 2 [Fragaria vesca subsp. vesca]|uniref:CD2 antigen cytoplasmic tail-binding protein 2 n=1 Tax=Fragaria vesca subsp. vesca TaxID=101020 RepID=UPI0002C33662|nr:PREDICTED: CD2 antigen cytoplasmic tail-binding protein 2 [Fragaria vesca subsp. vesca]